MRLSSFPKYAFIFLLTFAVCPALRADTTYTWQRGTSTVTSESANLNGSSYGSTFQNNDVITIYSGVTTSGQFNGNAVDSTGAMTIKSATPGTQVTIECKSNRRFCDYAHGTYNLSDLYFLNFGTYDDGGAVFYRNDSTPTTFVLSNVTVENGIANSGSAFRAATGMTVSGIATFKNNKVSNAGGAVLVTAGGNMTFQGADSNITFTGTQYKNDAGVFSVGYDVSASNITFNDAGTYSLGGGILTGGTVTINGANVTLGADSKSSVTGKTLLQAGTLTIESANYATSAIEVSAGATLKLKNTLNAPVTNSGSMLLTSGAVTITNLAGTSTTANLTWDSAVTGTKALTLNNTINTTFNGTITGADSITKTGTSQFTIPQNLTTSQLTVKQGTFTITGNNADGTPYSLYGNALIDGGTLNLASDGSHTVGKAGPSIRNGKIYVSAVGGKLMASGYRARIDGLYKPDGVETCGTLQLSTTAFIVGNSTFNGWLEVVGGTNRFSDEATKSAKGIILSGGTVQFLGDACGATEGKTTALSQNFYLKNSAALQCGWTNTFNLNGSFTDWEGADLTGKTLTIIGDSGYVVFNGAVNTKAILQLNDNAKIGGANNATFGGLSGTKTDKGLTLAAATTKNLTLNVAASTAPSYSAQLTGAFNLVKEGAGTQTFATVGIGSAASPLNSITINEGSVKMTDGAPIYAKTLTINEGGKLEFGTGTYKIKSETLGGTGEIALAFASDSEYTTLDFSGSTFTEASPALVSLDQSTYTLEQFKTYTIAKNVPATMESDFNYKSLLKGDDAYYFNLTRSDNSLVLQMDNSAVPEPAAWLLLLLGGSFLFKASPFRGGGTQCRRGCEEAV